MLNLCATQVFVFESTLGARAPFFEASVYRWNTLGSIPFANRTTNNIFWALLNRTEEAGPSILKNCRLYEYGAQAGDEMDTPVLLSSGINFPDSSRK
jgi:hypothetical protein